jgi:hypothetical protein
MKPSVSGIVAMKKIEKNYLLYSCIVFLAFLFFWADWEYTFIGGHFAAPLFELIFLIVCFLSVIPGFALTYEAKERKPVFWKLLVATLMPCSYIYVLYWGTGNY